MGNEYDYKCNGFELKAVTRSEFEALKRFGDYTELEDGTFDAGRERQGISHLLRGR